jgi:hypothetical protein
MESIGRFPYPKERAKLTMNLKTKSTEYIENIIAVIISGIFSFFFLIKSPLHPWYKGEAATDSCVFKTVSMMIEKGYMPYKDTFDHKGPLLYLINYWGDCISKYSGVWVIEFAFLTITLFMMYKTARLMCKRSTSVISVLIANSLLFEYFSSGNLVEEYAMTYISIAIFIFLDYLKNSKISNLRLLICGASLACTLLLRPNMISIWVVMCLAILIKELIGKQYKKLWNFILWFSIGMAIIFIPIIIWLGTNGALKQCWADYIEFNRLYTSAEGGRALFSAKWSSFLWFFNTSVYIISFTSLAYMCTFKDRFINISYLIYMTVTLLFVCMSGMQFAHYGMILVPAVVYPIAAIFSELELIEHEQLQRIITILLCVYSLNTLILPEWIDLTQNIPYIYESKDEGHISETVYTISDIINSTVDENDAISVYGNWNIIYIISNHIHATRYSYQSPVAFIMPEIMNEYITSLQEEAPKIIVVQQGHYDSIIENFLAENGYHILWSENDDEPTKGALVYTNL